MKKSVPYILFLILLVLLGNKGIAQTFNYQLQIKDSISGGVLDGAVILDRNGKYVGETGYRGRVNFTSAADPFIGEILHPSYSNKKVILGSTSEVKTVYLIPEPRQIDSVIVRAQKQVKNLSASQLQNQTIERSSPKESFVPGAFNVKEVVSTMAMTQAVNDPYIGGSVGINGMTADNTKVMIDGQPVTGNVGAGIDLSQISTNNIKAIQVYFGPQSIIYGSDASGGLINLISFHGSEKFSGILKASYQNIGQYNAEINTNIPIQNSRLNFGFSRYYFAGKHVYDSLVRKYTWLPKEQYNLNLGWNNKYRLSNNSDFYIKARTTLYRETLYDPGEPYLNERLGTAYAFDDFYTTWRNNSSLSFDIWGKKWKHELQNNFSKYLRTKESVRKDFISHIEQPIVDSSGNVKDDYSLIQSRYILTRQAAKLEVQAGGDFNIQSGSGAKLLQTEKRNEAAVFAMFKYNWHNWSFIPAARYNYYQNWANQILPAFQLQKRFSEAFYIETGYNKSYRVPSLKELYFHFVDINHNIVGNPNLQPETTESLHLGMEWKLDGLRSSAIIKLNSSYNYTQNKILLSSIAGSPSAFTYNNIGDIKNSSELFTVIFKPRLAKSSMQISSVTNWIYYLEYGPSGKTSSTTESIDFKWKSNTNWAIHLNSKTSIDQGVFVQDIDTLYLRQLKPFTLINLGVQKSWRGWSIESGVRNIANVRQVAFKDGLGSVGQLGSIHGTSGKEMQTSLGRNIYVTLSWSW